MSKKIDELVNDAIYICKDHEEVSPAMFQRVLPTDFYTGVKVFKELVKIGIISKYWNDILDEDEENLIGKVDKKKLKEYLTN